MSDKGTNEQAPPIAAKDLLAQEKQKNADMFDRLQKQVLVREEQLARLQERIDKLEQLVAVTKSHEST